MYPSYTRPFHDETLDLDKSNQPLPSGMIDCYRRIIICSIVMEQVYCNTLTGEPTFRDINS